MILKVGKSPLIQYGGATTVELSTSHSWDLEANLFKHILSNEAEI